MFSNPLFGIMFNHLITLILEKEIVHFIAHLYDVIDR
uniref:Uncharacterized protein n=1 Tax=Arundo donax TaxID=35708 RepID=A0A0A8ZL62_ARUDO